MLSDHDHNDDVDLVVSGRLGQTWVIGCCLSVCLQAGAGLRRLQPRRRSEPDPAGAGRLQVQHGGERHWAGLLHLLYLDSVWVENMSLGHFERA